MTRPLLSRRRTLALALPALVPFGIARADTPLDAALDRAMRFDRLRSIVVADAGGVLGSRAAKGVSLDRVATVKSVSKTLLALLTGIAIERGELEGLGMTLGEAAPGLIPAGADPQVADITIEDLITMRAGLERTSGRNYGGWVASGDWVADALSRPMVAEPGGRFLYSTGSFHVLGAVLAERTGESLLTLARRWLGRPLGIEIPPWTRDPQGRYMGGNNMALTPTGLARIGQMALDGGRWRGEQVVPAAWLAESWVPRTRSPFSGHDYGLGWFLPDWGDSRVAYARGYGGQMLYVAPDAGVTVAITSDPARPARSGGYAGDLNRLFADTILPAVS